MRNTKSSDQSEPATQILVAKTKDQVHEPLNSALSAPWDFLSPKTELHTNIIDSAKYFLDYLALSVSGSHSTRQRNNRKRKRSDDSAGHILQLKQLYVEGFTSDQIWEQATRILDSTSEEVERDYAWNAQNVGQINGVDTETKDLEYSDSEDITDQSSIDDGEEPDMESVSEAEASSNDELDLEMSGDEDIEQDDSALHDDDDNDDDDDKRDTYVPDPFGLNDGFFSIDDFNKQSELLERQDAKGGPDEDIDSEDEEIDWHVNPMAAGNSMPLSDKTSSRKNRDKVQEDETSDSSDEEGPTFGNANLDSDSDMEDVDDASANGADGTSWINTSEIKYADFFAPPPRKVTSKKSRPLPKTQPDQKALDNDIHRAMADVRRDLFEDEAPIEDDNASDDESMNPGNQHSTHEKQRARIADEIRRLEAANVAKKEWTLAGEARAVERPVNSLIEEDLEFERVGKPVTVVTTELSEDIEQLIKRRIVAKEFDEVIRRRPGVSDGQDVKRARFELEDTKPQQSLAELFETDHLRATDPDYVDPKNQKLMREHTEITNLWKEISSQLDTLSNWHYKPKAPQANINVVTDVATIMMEDAQPTANGAVGVSAALAPQEIYTPGGDGKVAGEVVMKNGESISKEEMTREEKGKLRRQQKKQKKASAGPSDKKPTKAAEKQQIVSDLKKGGVKVIGKQGEITDVYGSKIRDNSNRNGADTLKL